MRKGEMLFGGITVEIEGFSTAVSGNGVYTGEFKNGMREGTGAQPFFFLNLVTGPRRSLSLKLSDTRVYEPQIRARLGTSAHFCRVIQELDARGYRCSTPNP